MTAKTPLTMKETTRAVLVTTEIPLDIGVYDQIITSVGQQLEAAPGLRSHASHSTATGFVFTAIWDAEADHRAFFDAYVAPNLPLNAAVSTATAHNVLIPGRIAAAS